MDFEKREIDFREADRRYTELKHQLESGTISTEEFDAQRQRLMVQDDEGRWWAKSRKTSEWHYHDGSSWVRGTPPDRQPSRTPPAEGTPDRQLLLEPGERSSSRTTLPDSAPIRVRNREKQRRGAPRWVVIAVGLLAAVGIIWMLVSGILGGPTPEESTGSAPGYALIRHVSEAPSVENPSQEDHTTALDSL